uniref:Uncharacterized protein n=1 Tax=Panagrolaimus sp. PS1159 TaxID=55785 RepID=A0AC35GDG5_9BILA
MRSIIVGLTFTNHACIVLERSFATFFINTYENHKDKLKWSVFMISMELCSILMHYLIVSHLNSYVLAAIGLVTFEIMVGVVSFCYQKGTGHF